MKDDARVQLGLVLGYLRQVCTFRDVFCLYFEKHSLSQKQLARKLSIDASTVAHWRKNRRIPGDAAQVFLIAAALDLDSRERQYLLRAWAAHRSLTSLIPYIEEACKGDSAVDDVLEDVKEFLEVELKNLSVFCP